MRLLLVIASLAGIFNRHVPTLRDVWALAALPAPRPVRSEWCEQHIRLPLKTSAKPGAFTFVGREYMRGILDAVDQEDVSEIVLIAAPQIGKTVLVSAIMLSQGEVDAAPMMFAGPDQDYVRERRDIAYQMCEASPVLNRRIPPPSRRNDRWMDLTSCYVYLAWSGSPQRLSGRACKIVLCSEADRWHGSIELARQRTRAFWRSCVILEGTPFEESPVLYPAYRGSNRHHWHVPCPRCGEFQELRFFPHKEGPHAGRGGVLGLKDEKGEWRSPEEARQKVWYICEANGCRLEDRHKRAMVAGGQWVADGCRVEKDGHQTGEPSNPSRRLGFHLNALYGPTFTFGEAAEIWLQSRDTVAGRRSFRNDVLALPHQERGKVPEWRQLWQRARGSHRRGTVPSLAVFLTGAADVMGDNVYWIVRAWGEQGRSWLVDWGMVYKQTGVDGRLIQDSHLHQLVSLVLDREWEVAGENSLGETCLRVLRFGVDCQYDTMMVHQWVAGLRDSRVITVAGDDAVPMGVPYRFSVVEKNTRTGKPYPGGLRRWAINTGDYKADLHNRWETPHDKPGAWFIPSVHAEEAETYLRQVVNEAQVTRETKTGHTRLVWEIVDKSGIGNHALDAEVYAMAAADMMVEGVWENVAARFRESQRRQRVAEREADEPREPFVRRTRKGFVRRRS